MRTIVNVLALAILSGLFAREARAQSGRTAASPFQETSAGRAMQRITFGAIDCKDPPLCSTDVFTTSGLFENGTYKDTRKNYSGPLNQADVSNSLLLQILTQSQTFPSPATASGFTFSLRGSSVPVLESELYGPLFGERALTNGPKELSITFNVNRLHWNSLDGAKLRVGQSGLVWGDSNYDGQGGGYVGICRMDINSTVALGAVNYGVLEHLDVSVAVPVVHTSVTGSNEFLDFKVVNGQIVSTQGTPFTFVPQGRYYVTGSSTGLGDIVVGAKYAFVQTGTAGAAVAVRSSLPSGSLQDMTGTGELQTAVSFIGSYEREGFSPHMNIGYVAARGDVPNELDYTLGASYRFLPNRLTVGGEFVARREFNAPGFIKGPQIGVLRSPRNGELYPVHEFNARSGDLDLYFVALGGKVRLGGQLLATMYALLPAGDSGFQVARPTFNVGLNYAF